MKKFLEELRGARKIEWFLALLAIAALLLAQMGDGFSSDTHHTQQEQRIAAILNRIDGVGRVEVMLAEGDAPGVLVVAEGADDLRACLRIQYAVQTLLGTEASRIEIVPYRE